MIAGLYAPGPWTVGEMAILAVLLLGVVAIVIIAARAMRLNPPDWLIQMLVVVAVVVVAVLAIRLILSL